MMADKRCWVSGQEFPGCYLFGAPHALSAFALEPPVNLLQDEDTRGGADDGRHGTGDADVGFYHRG